MLLPSIFGENVFDDLLDMPVFGGFPEMDRKLLGNSARDLMKTDIREHEDSYDMSVDLPGFKKEEIQLKLQNGCLIISAAKEHDDECKNDDGKIIRRERYAGSMQRSFYVGKQLTEEDIGAKFENGVLELTIPKKAPVKAEDQPKLIQIN